MVKGIGIAMTGFANCHMPIRFVVNYIIPPASYLSILFPEKWIMIHYPWETSCITLWLASFLTKNIVSSWICSGTSTYLYRILYNAVGVIYIILYVCITTCITIAMGPQCIVLKMNDCSKSYQLDEHSIWEIPLFSPIANYELLYHRNA